MIFSHSASMSNPQSMSTIGKHVSDWFVSDLLFWDHTVSATTRPHRRQGSRLYRELGAWHGLRASQAGEVDWVIPRRGTDGGTIQRWDTQGTPRQQTKLV